MTSPTFTSGDTAPYVVTIKVGTTAYAVDPADTVTAEFVSIKGVAITSAVAQVSTTAGADWPNGIIAVAFDSTNSALLGAFDKQSVVLEIKIAKTVGGSRRFQTNYLVRKGYIP